MRLKRVWTAVSALAVVAGTTSSWAVQLKYAPQAGTTMRYELTFDSVSSIEVAGQAQTVPAKGKIEYSEEAKERKENGNTVVVMTFANGAVKAELMGQPIDVPLNLPVIQAEMSPAGQIVKTEILQPAPATVPQGFGGQGLDLNQFFGQMSSMGFPDKDVNVGESWETESTVNLPGGKPIVIKAKSTLKSVSEVEGVKCAEVLTEASFPVATALQVMGMTATMNGTYEMAVTSLFACDEGRLYSLTGKAKVQQSIGIAGGEGGEAAPMPVVTDMKFEMKRMK